MITAQMAMTPRWLQPLAIGAQPHLAMMTYLVEEKNRKKPYSKESSHQLAQTSLGR